MQYINAVSRHLKGDNCTSFKKRSRLLCTTLKRAFMRLLPLCPFSIRFNILWSYPDLNLNHSTYHPCIILLTKTKYSELFVCTNSMVRYRQRHGYHHMRLEQEKIMYNFLHPILLTPTHLENRKYDVYTDKKCILYI